MKKNRLLLVNDEEGLQEIFAAMLAGTGWQIEPALNGDEALWFYRKRGPYDLVLTDIQHPGPDGIEVVKRIRETNPAQAIAMVSGFAAEAQSIRHRFKIPMLSFPDKQGLVKLVESVTKPQLRVLLVAGDPAVKPLMAAYWNFEIELESAGNKALGHYRRGGPYDIVVSGHHHRGLNGVDLALAIRRVNPAQRIVVITEESSVMVRSMQRKLQGIPVIRLKKVIDTMLKLGQAKITAARAREPSLPISIRQRFREMTDRWTPMEMAFSELSEGGAQALLDLLDAASRHVSLGRIDRRCST
jgi:DNA-binding NtrC family response regulator